MTPKKKPRPPSRFVNGKRERPMVTLTMSREALTRLEELATARGETRSGVVEDLVMAAPATK